MANTYTQIYLHIVFAVSGRACVISSARREELQKYITGIVTRKGQKLIAIYCMPDHTHVLLGLKPNIAPLDLMGSAVGFHGRKVTARFPSPIHIWIVRPTTFAIKRRIIAESRSNKSISNFWGAIMFHTISGIFSSR